MKAIFGTYVRSLLIGLVLASLMLGRKAFAAAPVPEIVPLPKMARASSGSSENLARIANAGMKVGPIHPLPVCGPVPEMDPGMASGGLTLLLFGAVLLTERYRARG